ncbi:MAG: TadE/TadG family type IV pilus assembly protein [Bdellovibrionota bacterium]
MRDARPETTDAHGATMVELAIVLPIFLLILLLSFDLLWVSYQLVTTQFVATRVLRQAIVGPRERPSVYPTQEAWIEQEIISLARGFSVSLHPEDIAICPYRNVITGAACDPLADDAGAASEMIAVKISAPAPGYFWLNGNVLGGKVYRLEALAVARNEKW